MNNGCFTTIIFIHFWNKRLNFPFEKSQKLTRYMRTYMQWDQIVWSKIKIALEGSYALYSISGSNEMRTVILNLYFKVSNSKNLCLAMQWRYMEDNGAKHITHSVKGKIFVNKFSLMHFQTLKFENFLAKWCSIVNSFWIEHLE